MSNRRKLRKPSSLSRHPAGHPRRYGFPKPGPGEGYTAIAGIIPDRTIDGAVQDARQATHDALIEAWGPKRRSGIWWTQYEGATALRAYQDIAGDTVRGTTDPVGERILTDNPRGLLVVAWALVDEGEAPNPTEAGWR